MVHDLSPKVLNNIDLADIRKFDLMKTIGQQMAEYIVSNGNIFPTDLVDEKGKTIHLFLFLEIFYCIQKQISCAHWIDTSPA